MISVKILCRLLQRMYVIYVVKSELNSPLSLLKKLWIIYFVYRIQNEIHNVLLKITNHFQHHRHKHTILWEQLFFPLINVTANQSGGMNMVFVLLASILCGLSARKMDKSLSDWKNDDDQRAKNIKSSKLKTDKKILVVVLVAFLFLCRQKKIIIQK